MILNRLEKILKKDKTIAMNRIGLDKDKDHFTTTCIIKMGKKRRMWR